MSFIVTITWNSYDLCIDLGKLNFTQNLYEPMKPCKFVMLFLMHLLNVNQQLLYLGMF